MNIQLGYHKIGIPGGIACDECGEYGSGNVKHLPACSIGELSPIVKPMDQVAILIINPLDPEKKLSAIEQGHIQAIDGDQVTVVIRRNVPFGILQLAEGDPPLYGEEIDLNYDKTVTITVNISQVRFLAHDEDFSDALPF